MRVRFRNAVVLILAANIIMFVLQMLIPGFTDKFILVSKDVLARPWILLTSMFLHANPTHLLFNMYVLLMFGPLIESRIGTKRFLNIYFISGILASIASVFFYPASLGASGAIMGMMGVTIMLFPDLKVLLFFIVPMSLRTAGILIAIIDIIGFFNPGGNIANVAHLVGLGCGLVYGYYLLKQKSSFNVRFHRKPKGNSIELKEDEIDDYIKHGRL